MDNANDIYRVGAVSAFWFMPAVINASAAPPKAQTTTHTHNNFNCHLPHTHTHRSIIGTSHLKTTVIPCLSIKEFTRILSMTHLVIVSLLNNIGLFTTVMPRGCWGSLCRPIIWKSENPGIPLFSLYRLSWYIGRLMLSWDTLSLMADRSESFESPDSLNSSDSECRWRLSGISLWITKFVSISCNEPSYSTGICSSFDNSFRQVKNP